MEPLNRQNIMASLHKHLGCPSEVISLTPIQTGLFNTSFFVHTGTGEYVLRVAPSPESVFLFYERDMMKQEPAIHACIREKTSVPVAEIVAFDQSHEILNRDFIIMQRLPGIPLSDTRFADNDLIMGEVGHCLAQVHACTEKQYGYLGAHRPMEPQQRWIDAFVIMWRKLLEDIEETGLYSKSEKESLLRLLDKYLPLFNRDTPASLLHMDIWAQNILVNDTLSSLTGLVDWDRALWGDPEIEFAVLDYCGISTPSFWEGYGMKRDTSHEAQMRTVFYFLYELQKYIVIYHGRHSDTGRARGYKRQAMQIVNRVLV
jgi:fructosamine-3-kinase